MNTKSATFSIAIAATFLSSALVVSTAKAEIVSHSKDIIVDKPADLPEPTQVPGIAFQLHSGVNGGTYLYIEQHGGDHLVVLDVTDPAQTKTVRVVNLTVPGPFDFVRPLGGTAMLVRFRNNLGVAVLDLRNAREPVLKTVSGLQYPGHTEPLGETGFLMVNERHVDAQTTPRDYQVVDTSNPADPVLLDTVKLVSNKATRDETGTTFLLGSEGLTIIRRPRVEAEYKVQQDTKKAN
ncbi:LVIVD repeat-containing protein [Edaphobacter bradus]|uniref:hypothetical protein n=1 Tax=Edaphobacter bradus TaxID=2259016 RepID=UPI0021E0111F|nr:hypothetical protein [Edaphobacter bradus]